MAVTDITDSTRVNGDGSTVAFTFDFPVQAAGDLVVKKIVNSTEVATLQVLNTDYTVVLNTVTEGGTVTYTTAPLSTEDSHISRLLTLDQGTIIPTESNFPEASIENELDRSRMIDIQLQAQINRALLLTQESALTGISFPSGASAALRATKVIAWDTAGTGLTLGTGIGNFRGDWAVTTAYAVRDLIKDTSNDNIYYCNTAHTSVGAEPISTNADVAKWDLIVDAASAAAAQAAAEAAQTAAETAQTAAETAQTAAELAETNAETAEVNAELAETNAETAQTAAELAETNAETAEVNAELAETNAETAETNAETAETNAETAETNAEASAGALAFQFVFDSSTTMADPTTGKVRLNNATVSSVTAIAFDALANDTGNPDVSDFLASLDDGTNTAHEGYIIFKKSGTPATFAVFSITGAVTDNTGWLEVAVTHVASNGALSAADVLFFSFARSGNMGGGMANIVEDITPQLGGDLDLNGKNIDFPTTANISDCLDEDAMGSNSPTKICTQQSIKAYADTKIANVSEDASPTLGGVLDCNDLEVQKPKFKDYGETLTEANTSTAYTIDLVNGNVFELTLTGDCTFTFSNPPADNIGGSFTLVLKQDGTGSRTTTWPASVDWAGGSAPTLTTTASAVDILTFVTTDAGTTWWGFLGGADFS